MTYYSCSPLLTIQGRYKTCPYESGPRGIRTLGLLNAIETRSQTALWAHLSYQFSVIRDQRMLATDNGLLITTCGPGGIRTRDLFSAIEARSQLRYRPGQRIAFYLLCAALSSKCRRSCARRQFGADLSPSCAKTRSPVASRMPCDIENLCPTCLYNARKARVSHSRFHLKQRFAL